MYSAFVSKGKCSVSPPVWRSVRWRDLYFPNPLAPAGGVDKSACHIKAWWALGAGFLEIGTITPEPQTKNTGVVLKRDIATQALWNYLGFPNMGAGAVAKRLKKVSDRKWTPIFANIGRNASTPNSEAEKDYLKCIDILHPYVSGFVINISSPNTKGLRGLARPTALKKLLTKVRDKIAHLPEVNLPFLVKWSPDLSEKDFLHGVDVAMECGVSGHILCNSTTFRNEGAGEAKVFPLHGGVSGMPLARRAKHQLVLVQKHLGVDRIGQLLVSVGGVMSAEDVFQRLAMGADLVQVYSALVFEGPWFFRQVSQKSRSVF